MITSYNTYTTGLQLSQLFCALLEIWHGKHDIQRSVLFVLSDSDCVLHCAGKASLLTFSSNNAMVQLVSTGGPRILQNQVHL